MNSHEIRIPLRRSHRTLYARLHDWVEGGQGQGASGLSEEEWDAKVAEVDRLIIEPNGPPARIGGVVVSPCLLGIPCRYDAKTKQNPLVVRFLEGASAPVLPLCTEVFAGLGVPRPPMYFVGGDGAALLRGGADLVSSEGRSCGQLMEAGARLAAAMAQAGRCTRAVLKAKSPSCGLRRVYGVQDPKSLVEGRHAGGSAPKKILQPGQGVFAALLERAGVECVNEEELEAAPAFLS